MFHRPGKAIVAAALTAAALTGYALQQGCDRRTVQAPSDIERDGGYLAAAVLPAGGATVAPSAAVDELSAQDAGADALAAVRTVKLFCDLVDSRRLRGAGDLLASPGVWRRRNLRDLRGFRFLSARVHPAKGGDRIIVAARVRVRKGAADAAAHVATTVSFTLERSGSGAGEWRISRAVTRPYPRERGPS